MTDGFLEALPKVEIHLHLEGAIPLEALLDLIRKTGSTEVSNLEDLRQRFRYRDFPSFIETWVWKNRFLRNYADFELIASAVAADLANQNIVYAETFFSPADFEGAGLDPGGIAEAIRRGLDDHADRIEVKLIADLVRDFGPIRGRRTLDAIAGVRESAGIVGIGIGGSEQRFPPEPFAEVYARARALGLRTSCHAGEAAGPDSVWGALRALKVDRIGHGTRAIEDPALVHELVESRLHVELCPISNLRTGVSASLEDHPVATYLREGLNVSINTDDPKMFNTTLVGEYALLMERLGLTYRDVVALVRSAIDAAWCDDTTKARLRNRLATRS